MDKERYEELCHQLRASDRIKDILDDTGAIKPSQSALDHVESDHPDESDAEKWRLAQEQTLMDLVEKYQSELPDWKWGSEGTNDG
jgi:hypothetical protein